MGNEYLLNVNLWYIFLLHPNLLTRGCFMTHLTFDESHGPQVIILQKSLGWPGALQLTLVPKNGKAVPTVPPRSKNAVERMNNESSPRTVRRPLPSRVASSVAALQAAAFPSPSPPLS